MNARIALFCRWPAPGAAKTRLIPALGEAGAADLHRRLAEATVATVRESGLSPEIRFTGAGEEEFRAWLGGDLAYADQGGGDLGARMKRAADPLPVIFLGADCPDLRPEHLRRAVAALDENEVVLGPASDGGYWLIGLARRHDYLFDDMPWGGELVLTATLARLRERGIEPLLLDELADCDRPGDLERWPELLR